MLMTEIYTNQQGRRSETLCWKKRGKHGTANVKKLKATLEEGSAQRRGNSPKSLELTADK